MDMTRPSGHVEDPIKTHHPEEEEHHESRTSKMFGKVKARAKKIKNSLTKHGNDEEEDDDEIDEPEPAKHVASVNEVPTARSYGTSQPETLSHPQETNVPTPEKIIPSETKDSNAVYSSDDTRRVEPEPSRANATYEHEAPSYPVKTSDMSKREDRRETHHVHTPARSDDVKVETTALGRDIPEGFKLFNKQFSPEFPGTKERNDFDSKAEAQEPKPTTYTEMIGSATTFVTGKAIATKNAVASSLGYSGETTGVKEESPVSGETVAEKLSTDDESVKETASPVKTKLPLSGGGSGAEEMEQEEGKGVPSRDYMVEKMTPEEEDKGLSDMVDAKLTLGGEGEKKTTTAKDVEVAMEKIPTTAAKDVDVPMEKIPSDKPSEEMEHGEAVVEEETGGGGMVGKIKGAYNYWIGGTATEEVKPKSPLSVDESTQSLGSTVGTKGFSDPGESVLGETGGSTGAVPVHRGI